MAPSPKKSLNLRKLDRTEIGDFGMKMMTMLRRSSDPFAAAEYIINAEPSIELSAGLSAESKRKITPAHILNKIIAVAVTENPIYKRIVLGGSMYEIDDIHIANAFLLPGKEQALTYVVLENPHRKSLVRIQEEALRRMIAATQDYKRRQASIATVLTGVLYKTGLDCLVSEKLAFTVGYRNRLISNIMLMNHEYGGETTFKISKPIIAAMKIPLRIHTYGPKVQPCVDNGQMVVKKVFPLTVIADHRIVHGVHGQRLGQSLERIAADPAKFLL